MGICARAKLRPSRPLSLALCRPWKIQRAFGSLGTENFLDASGASTGAPAGTPGGEVRIDRPCGSPQGRGGGSNQHCRIVAAPEMLSVAPSLSAAYPPQTVLAADGAYPEGVVSSINILILLE
jgi:hypothetical protein